MRTPSRLTAGRGRNKFEIMRGHMAVVLVPFTHMRRDPFDSDKSHLIDDVERFIAPQVCPSQDQENQEVVERKTVTEVVTGVIESYRQTLEDWAAYGIEKCFDPRFKKRLGHR